MCRSLRHFHYPHILDGPLNEVVDDKIRQYRTDYNNRLSNDISFIHVITSTSDRLHSEFVRLLFLQDHRETDRFFAVSGVHHPQSTTAGLFHYRYAVFSSQIKEKVNSTLDKAEVLRVNLNIDGVTTRLYWCDLFPLKNLLWVKVPRLYNLPSKY